MTTSLHTPFRNRFLIGVGERYEPSLGSDSQRTPKGLRVLDLSAALETRWVPDSHLVTYVVHRDGKPLPKQPRVKKEQLPRLSEGYTIAHFVRFADVDCPGHGVITAEQIQNVSEALRHYTCGWYPTRGGIRVFQTLTRPLTPVEYEVSIQKWLPELKALLHPVGLCVDAGCKDWTRMFRLPKVVRDGRNYWDTLIHDSNLTPIDPGDCTPPPVRKLWAPAPRQSTPTTQHTRYGQKALENQCDRLRAAPLGERHKTLTQAAFSIGQLIAGGQLEEGAAVSELESSIQNWNDPRKHLKTLTDCLRSGQAHPYAPKGGVDLDSLRRWLADRAPLPIPDPEIHGFGLEEV